MAGRGSLAGLLAMAIMTSYWTWRARGVAGRAAHAGAGRGQWHRSVLQFRRPFSTALARVGFSGVQNFPTVGLIDGTFRANLEETGMGYGLEVEMIPWRIKTRGLTRPALRSGLGAR